MWLWEDQCAISFCRCRKWRAWLVCDRDWAPASPPHLCSLPNSTTSCTAIYFMRRVIFCTKLDLLIWPTSRRVALRYWLTRIIYQVFMWSFCLLAGCSFSFTTPKHVQFVDVNELQRTPAWVIVTLQPIMNKAEVKTCRRSKHFCSICIV